MIVSFRVFGRLWRVRRTLRTMSPQKNRFSNLQHVLRVYQSGNPAGLQAAAVAMARAWIKNARRDSSGTVIQSVEHGPVISAAGMTMGASFELHMNCRVPCARP
jgi:hypothetical protein